MSGPVDLKAYNEALKANASQQVLTQQRKYQDSKPVFVAPKAADMGGMQNDVEHNAFLKYYHLIGKNVQNVSKLAFDLFEQRHEPEVVAALQAFHVAASKLVHDASSIYATRGTDIEHDADSWQDLVDMVGKFHTLVEVSHGPAAPSPVPPPDVSVAVGQDNSAPVDVNTVATSTTTAPTLEEVIAKAKEQANVQQSSPDSGQSNEGN